METQEKIVNRYTEKPVKTKNGFAMLALILVLFFGSLAVAIVGPILLWENNFPLAVTLIVVGFAGVFAGPVPHARLEDLKPQRGIGAHPVRASTTAP